MKNGDILINEDLFAENVKIIDNLFDYYFDSKKADAPNVDAAYKEFCYSLLDVDPFQIDEIMSTAMVLCMEHERAGFEAGIKTRIQLERELEK